MNNQPESLVSRFFGGCLLVLLGVMALYGAVVVLQTIWIPLCITAAAAVGVGIVGWLLHLRFWRW